MDVKTDRQNGTLIASVEGRIDGATAREFEEIMTAAIDDGDKAVVIDLEKLSYISSAGLRSVLLIAKGMWKRKGKCVVCSLDESNSEVFRISGFDKIINIHASTSAAIDSVAG